MQHRPFRRLLLTAVLAVSLGALVLPGSLPVMAAAAATAQQQTSQPGDLPGTVTKLSDGTVERSFTLYATDGYTTLPDGRTLYIWGYSGENKPGTATLPGPRIRVNEGEQVKITLVNAGPSAKDGVKAQHTIHLHGLDVDQANDGVPHTSTQLEVGQQTTYTFTADHAGTYWYHCHVTTIEHLQMGMYGALVVMPKDGSNRAWTGGPKFDREVTMVLSEVDATWHDAIAARKTYDPGTYKPGYYLINGKGFPDVATDPQSIIAGEVGDTVLVRLINAGYTWKAMHMHGFHYQVIASDGRPLPMAYEKDTLSIAPGERYDILVKLNKKGEYPFHSHAITDNLNNGVYPGGIHTMVYAGVPVPAAAEHQQHTPATPATPAAPAAGDIPLLTPTPHTAEVTVGAKQAKAGEKALTLDTVPAEASGEVMVTHAAVRDLLGATVAWDGGEKRLTVSRGLNSIKLWIGKLDAEVNGAKVTLAAAPSMAGSSILLPLKAVAAALEGQVHAMGQTVHITLPGEVVIPIKSSAFSPETFRVKAGTVVIWRNDDSRASHTVMTDLGPSGLLNYGGKHIVRFDNPGTYKYWCDLHTNMAGSVIVE